MPTLHVLQGPDKGRTYSTPNEPALIGRTSEHIQLSDNSASRRHAEIRPSNGSWVLVDLNSSNGTYLNGQRVLSPSPIKHGDQIKVGSTLMVFSGKDQVSGFSGAQMIRDLVDFDMSAGAGGSSILSAVDASEESVILQPPEAADAVAAWNVVYKIAETIGTLQTVDEFLERLADLVFDHIVADRLVILMHKEGEEDLVPQVIRHRGRDRDRSKRPKIVTSRTIVKHVCEKKDGVICANAMNDERFTADSKQDSIHLLGLRSIICVPIIARDQVHGVLHLDSSMSHHTYTHEQLRLAVAIGRLAGMAIENMQLLESRVKNERLAAAGEAVAYLSHHIRNILQGMQGGADVVEMSIKRKSMDSVVSGWGMVRRNLDRIYLLALNMLTFSKDRQPKIETVQINRVIEDVVSLAQHKATERHVILLTELEEMPPIPMDADGMHQVIHNMVLNAIDAMHDTGGRIMISNKYQVSPPQVMVTVSDTGPGIPDDQIGSIFDPFHSSKGHGGTGLGLAAAKKIVSELNGQIRVDTKVGEGTAFHITLPAEHVRLADSGRTHHG